MLLYRPQVALTKTELLMLIKNIKGFLAVVACLFSLNSLAAPIVDYERVGLETKLSWGESLSWTHNIMEWGFELGSAESASIIINLRDDTDSKYFPFEVALIQLGQFDLGDGGIVDPTTTWFGSLGVNSLAKLNADGTLFVNVTSTLGDFFVGQSTLTVVTKAAAVTVPEPSAMLLFGLGLFGLGVLRKKARA